MKNTFLSRDVSFSERTWTSKVCPPKKQRFRQTKVRSSAPLSTQCQKFACLLPGNWSQTVEGRWFPAVNLLGNKEVNRCWLVFCWRLTPCCPPGSIFILLLYNSPLSDILSNAVPTFPLHTCQVCDFYPKRHFVPGVTFHATKVPETVVTEEKTTTDKQRSVCETEDEFFQPPRPDSLHCPRHSVRYHLESLEETHDSIIVKLAGR